MKIFQIIIITISLSTMLNAQNRCGTEEYTIILEKKYPEYDKYREKVDIETKEWIKENTDRTKGIVITIPVVVHVIWNTNQENISDAQIFSQIDVLNKDYRRTNVDAINTPSVWQNIATDCEIEFCLATIDPNGNATTGITRTQTNQNSFSIQNDGMKYTSSGGIDAWPNDDYLNVWVCNLGGGLLGYATPPSNFLSNEDGVVIGYQYFGTTGTVQNPYHKGRTTTHEVGHWLNLEHVWGAWGNCGNDNVNDTPTQEEENYGCPSFPHNANSCGTNNANGDMFMNYMDYTNDACMNMFTNGQKTRMVAAINQYRPNLIGHNLCTSNPPPPPSPSWNCINGNCIDPSNGTGSFLNYNTCISNCNCGSINPPINQGFEINNLPSNWTIVNNDNNKTWEINEQVGYNSSKSIYINNADYPANGEYDDLILPSINLVGSTSADVSFNYAYSLWTNPNASQIWSDTLQIIVSDDCGVTWNKIWEKAGINLVTTTPAFNGFTWYPSINSDWNSETINLSNYLNQDDIVIKFRNVNQYENNLFLDNININTNQSTTINTIDLINKVFPNPTSGIIHVEIEGNKKIFNILGEKVIDTNNNVIDIKQLDNGIYILSVNGEKHKIIKE